MLLFLDIASYINQSKPLSPYLQKNLYSICHWSLCEIVQLPLNCGLSSGLKSKIFYLNTHLLNLTLDDNSLRDTFKKAGMIYFDGWGAVWAAKIFGIGIKERSTTMSFFGDFCKLASEKKLRIYFLGADKRDVKEAVRKIKLSFIDINIVGYRDGYFALEDSTEIIRSVNRLKVDILIVGMSSPRQEMWLVNNRDKLNIKVGWAVGSLFEYLSGAKPWAPFCSMHFPFFRKSLRHKTDLTPTSPWRWPTGQRLKNF